MAWNALPDDLRGPSLSADNFRKRLNMTLSALDALRNALYKVKTYLLTFLVRAALS